MLEAVSPVAAAVVVPSPGPLPVVRAFAPAVVPPVGEAVAAARSAVPQPEPEAAALEAVSPVAAGVVVPFAGPLPAVRAFAPAAVSPVVAAAVAEVVAAKEEHFAVQRLGAEVFVAEAPIPPADAVAVQEAPSVAPVEEQDSARPAVQRPPWVEYWVEPA